MQICGCTLSRGNKKNEKAWKKYGWEKSSSPISLFAQSETEIILPLICSDSECSSPGLHCSCEANIRFSLFWEPQRKKKNTRTEKCNDAKISLASSFHFL